MLLLLCCLKLRLQSLPLFAQRSRFFLERFGLEERLSARWAEVEALVFRDGRDGRLIGDFGATATPGGILDYQTSGYFGLDGWREHPLFLHPRLPEIERIDGTVLSLTTRGTVGRWGSR